MLTRELLEFRTRVGAVIPRLVDPTDPEVLGLAEAVLELVRAHVGERLAALDEALEDLAASAARKRVLGLAKLVLDRAEVDQPTGEHAARRAEVFAAAADLFRSAAPDATRASHRARLGEALGELEPIAEALYADLPERRRILSVPELTPLALVHRYNLAQVQGLVFYASQLALRLRGADATDLRRVLGWLRFCRLVAEVRRRGDELELAIEGPTAILEMPKAYGLELASFVAVVPTLPRFELVAAVRLPRRDPLTLTVTERMGLVATLPRTGYVPPEVEAFTGAFAGTPWRAESAADPRPVGLGDLMVPDLLLRHASGREVAIEVFHRWHDRVLGRRLAQLEARPDPDLVLAIDRAIAKREEVARALDGAAIEWFPFSGFPTRRRLDPILRRLVDAETPARARP